MISRDPYQRFSEDPTRHKHHGELTSQMVWERARRGRVKSQQAIMSLRGRNTGMERVGLTVR